MMRAVLAGGLAVSALLSTGALAQSMPGMDMPAQGTHAHGSPAAARPAEQARAQDAGHPAPDHGGTTTHDHSAMPDMDQDALDAVPVADGGPVGTALPAGTLPPPPPPRDHYADRTYGADAMAASRAALRADHGGATFSQILFNIAEYQSRRGGDGYRWDGEAWFGGDIHRLSIKSEGEGRVHGALDHAEVQALYSRALDPYWNLQAGLRYDLRPDPSRTYATIGVEGLAPYWFEVEAALFLSDKGDVLGRLEAWHDLRLTQRLVLQPRAELNLSAQDIPAQRIGAGLANAELGLRLRYEIRRDLAPYLGITWDRKVGDTARFARRAGEDAEATGLAIGLRAWF